MTRRGIFLYTYKYGWWVVLVLGFGSPLVLRDGPLAAAWGFAAVLAALFVGIRLTIGNEIQGMSDDDLAEVAAPFLDAGEQVEVAAVASWRFVVAVTAERVLLVRMATLSGRPHGLVILAPLSEVSVRLVRRRPFADLIVLQTAAGRRWNLDLVQRSRLVADRLIELLSASSMTASDTQNLLCQAARC